MAIFCHKAPKRQCQISARRHTYCYFLFRRLGRLNFPLHFAGFALILFLHPGEPGAECSNSLTRKRTTPFMGSWGYKAMHE